MPNDLKKIVQTAGPASKIILQISLSLRFEGFLRKLSCSHLGRWRKVPGTLLVTQDLEEGVKKAAKCFH